MKPSFLSSFARGGVIALFLLTGCMETMPRPERPRPPRPERPRPERPRPPRPERPIACTQEYAPVCAAKGYSRKTFSNACMAQAQRYTVISPRPCGGGRDGQ